MLSQEMVKRLADLRKKGHTRRSAAKELGIDPKTAAKYWGGSIKTTRMDSYFFWAPCHECGKEYPHPMFLGTWISPCCRKRVSWTECQYED